jgi:hypothetical protein
MNDCILAMNKRKNTEHRWNVGHPMDIVAINYSRDVGWAGALTAEICRSEPSTALVTFNYDHRPEIGVYRVLLPAEKNVVDCADNPQFIRGEIWFDLGAIVVGQSGGRR